MKISVKFGGIISIIVIAIVFLAFLTMGSLSSISRAASEQQTKNAPIIITSLNLQKEIIQIQQWLTDISATRGEPGFDDGFDRASEHYESAKELIIHLKELGVPVAVLDPLAEHLDEYYVMGVEMANTYVNQGTDAGNIFMEQFDPFAQTIEENIEVLVVDANNKFGRGNSSILSFADELNTRSTILFGIVILVCILSMLAIQILVVHPIVKITKHSQKLADLDIKDNIPLELTRRKDEVGLMANSLGDITASIRTVIGSVKQSSEHLASSAEQLFATVQQSTSANEEVSKAVEEIANSSSNQASSTEEGSIKASLLGASIEKDQEYLKELNIITQKIKTSVEEGLINIENISVISEESRIATNAVQEGITKTNASAKKIGEVSNMIASIADQTNLLALNAAIEAARAGDAGRGFAVVADEVRQLAEKSRLSTRDIDHIINELQINSEHAVSQMEKVDVILKEQAQSVDISKRKFITIAEVITKARQTVENLNNSGIEMNSMKTDILKTLQELSVIAEENSAETQQVSASVEEQTASMEEISNSSAGLAQLANDLQVAVSRFRI